MLGDVFERFVAKSPIAVIVRGTLERVLGADQLGAPGVIAGKFTVSVPLGPP